MSGLLVRLSKPRLWVPFPMRMRWAQVRGILVRHRVWRRVVAGALVFVVGLWVLSTVADASRARTKWGELTEVVVATSDSTVGQPAAGVRVELRPASFTPHDALLTIPGADHRLALPLRMGDVVTERHLSQGRAAQVELPDGQRALSLPIGLGIPPVGPGDAIEVFVFAEETVRASATVVSVDDAWIGVSVEEAHVLVLADALASGKVIVVLG